MNQDFNQYNSNIPNTDTVNNQIPGNMQPISEPIQPQQPVVEQTPVAPQQPIVEQTPVVPQQPIVEQTPVVPQQPVVEQTPVVPQQPVVEPTPVAPQQPVVEPTPVAPQQPVVEQTPVVPQQPVVEPVPQVQPMQQPVQPQAPKKKGKALKIIGIIFLVIVALAIIGFLTDQKEKSNINTGDNKNTSDSTNTKLSTFYAEGYTLSYDSKWSKASVETTNGGTGEVLMYGYKEAYLAPVGTSSLSSFEEQYKLDFSTTTGKKKLYDEFYSYWNSGNTKLFGGSNGFSLLTGTTYYATMDYGTSSTNINGKMYLLVDTKNEVIISLMSNISSDFSGNSDRILTVLKTININIKYDDVIANELDRLSAWNQYSSVRSGKLGTKKNINGGWKTLSGSSTYWVFKNGEFWWYKSADDLKDNYWYGKAEIYTGKTGIKKVGLDENNIDAMLANNKGKVSENNIYTIIFKPSKVIAGGVDKSSTNISGENWQMVWIIVDHGSEGLEAQVLNVLTADTMYLVKVND